MHLFYKRPLLLAMTCFLVISVVAAHSFLSLRFILTVSFAILTCIFTIISIIITYRKSKYSQILFTLSLSIFFCFLASFSSRQFFDNKLAVLESTAAPVRIVAEIRECTYSAPYLSEYTVAVREIDGEKAAFKASLSIEGQVGLLAGNLLSAEVTFSTFDTEYNGYDVRANRIADGVLVCGNFAEFEVLQEESGSCWHFFEKLRNKIAHHIDDSKLGSSAGLLKAFLLGNRNDLDDSTSLNFRRLGITHILSISGTHFTTLLGMVALLFSFLHINKRLSYALLIPLAIFYIALTGFLPSVLRAGIMSILSYIGLLSGRMRDSYTALFAAVTGILIVQPYAVFSIGLWLSFSATFAILILIEILGVLQKAARAKWYKKILYFVFSRILITLFVSVITLPITMITFGETSLLAPIGNLLVVPFFELFLYLAPFAVIFSNFTAIAFLSDKLHDAIMGIIEFLCRADNILISLRPPFVLYFSVAGCIATMILLALPLKKKGFILLPGGISTLAIAIGLGIFMHIHFDVTEITYFTYKINDGIVLTDQNESLYIDITNGSASPAYKACYIAEQHFSSELAGILFTHYHKSHINTLKKLANSVNIHAVYIPYTEREDIKYTMQAIEEVADEKNIKIIRYFYNTPLAFENCTVTVYEPEYLTRSTHPVVSLLLKTKDQEILYLGSSFNEAKQDLTPKSYAAEYIFYGQHHPIAKEPFAIPQNAYPVYGNQERLALATNKKHGTVFNNTENQYTVTLK